ncbi:tetratricopeptide repeat protein [Chitinibacteraceae bacterium HSL-7]
MSGLNYRSLSFAMAAAALLGACATPSAPSSPAPDAASDPVAEVAPPVYPAQALSEDMLLRFLVGDIALQRGQFGLASKAWSELSERSTDPRVAKRATEVAIASGQLNQALDACGRWLAAEPDSLEARQIMVSLLLRAKRLEDAKPHIEALLTRSPNEVAPFFLQLHRLWVPGTDPAAVIKLTEELAAAYPTRVEAQLALAIAYGSNGQRPAALTQLDKVDAMRANWEPALLYRAEILEVDAARQRAFLEDAVKRVPASVTLKDRLARNYAESKRYAEAAALYDEALRIQPNDVEALIGSGLVALERRDYELAQARLSSAVAKAPRSGTSLHFYLGIASEEQRQWQQAARWYESTEGDNKAQAERRLVRVYGKLGRATDAQALIAKMPVGTVAERVSKAQTEAGLWRELNDPTKAYAVLSGALKRDADQPELLYDRSLIAETLGDLKAAEADLRRYLELRPNDATGLNALGYTLASRTERFDDAERYLAQAIKLEPDNPVIQDSMGWLRFRQGRAAEAHALLEKAYAGYKDPEIGAHLVDVLWALGRQDEARKVYEEAVLLDGEHKVLLETGKRLGLAQ